VDVQRGQSKQGLQEISTALQKGYTLSESDALKLATTYIQEGDTKSAVMIYAQLTAQFPTKIDYWSQLIAGYIQLKDRDNAVSTLRKALAQPGVGDDAAFKAKALSALQQLGATP